MGISSAAEAKLEASIRPEITVVRARTSYPRRHRPVLKALSSGESAAAPGALPAGQAGAADAAEAEASAADAGTRLAGEPGSRHQDGARDEPAAGAGAAEAAPAAGTARLFRSTASTTPASFTSAPFTAGSFTAASFTATRTVRTSASAASARAFRPGAHAYRKAGPARPAPVPATGQVRVVRPASVRPGAAATAGRIGPSAGPARQDAARGRRAVAVPAPVRLTRRGRFVIGLLTGLVIASAVALIWLAVTGQAQAAGQAAPVPSGGHMLRVVVRPGQTLWSIAEKADPAADPRIVIQQIMDDNALRGTSVSAGQVLWVPRG